MRDGRGGGVGGGVRILYKIKDCNFAHFHSVWLHFRHGEELFQKKSQGQEGGTTFC